MNIFMICLLFMSTIISSSESTLHNIYLRRIADAFIKIASRDCVDGIVVPLECSIDVNCMKNQICLNELCRDPCPGSCGIDAECKVLSHTLSCSCPLCYIGDPNTQCIPLRGLKFFICQFERLVHYLGGI